MEEAAESGFSSDRMSEEGLLFLNEWCYNVTDCIVLILSLFVESVSVNILISVKPVRKSPLFGRTPADIEA